jgi:hypothetical protein
MAVVKKSAMAPPWPIFDKLLLSDLNHLYTQISIYKFIKALFYIDDKDCGLQVLSQHKLHNNNLLKLTAGRG